MNIFLSIASLILLVSGSLLLLSPSWVERISKVTNRILFNLDDKLHTIRRPIGVLFLFSAIFLWYIALYK